MIVLAVEARSASEEEFLDDSVNCNLAIGRTLFAMLLCEAVRTMSPDRTVMEEK